MPKTANADLYKDRPSLAQRFGANPFSVIDRRSGDWQAKKKAWLELGIQSELGRDEGLLGYGVGSTNAVSSAHAGISGGTSVFDPAVCEIAYSWFSGPGQYVLDPFAGGSVRGLVASRLGRNYTGVELSGRQVEANQAQLHIADRDHDPVWIQGDSAVRVPELLDLHGGPFADLVFTCPPYFDLEVYSDDPADISAMDWDTFQAAYAQILGASVQALRQDRFAIVVTSDVRDRKGNYRGLVARTIEAMEAAGASLYNDVVLLDMLGSVALRAARPFEVSRKLARVHQNFLVFVKGDGKRAATAIKEAQEAHAASLLPEAVQAAEEVLAEGTEGAA